MKPREIIYICNEIARLAMNAKEFPQLLNKHIVDAASKSSQDLSDQIVNSYSKIYENIPEIVDALVGQPMKFKGSVLDKLAHRTASTWKKIEYSPLRFRQILCEIGLLGRVRRHQRFTKFYEADFEYFMEDRLVVHPSDDCVIHPIFFEKLNIDTSDGCIIYPFPDHPSFSEIND
jgi:hypothetical protein